MLLAKIEQTENKLVITPQKSAATKAFLWAVLGMTLPLAEVYHVFGNVAFFVIFIIVAAGAIYIPRIFQQWPEPPFAFDRTNRKVLRNDHVLGLFSNILHVSLLVRQREEGRSFRLALVMTNFDEWKVVETSPQPALMGHRSGFSRIVPPDWEPYPSDRLPQDATEYELVMLANLIHDYLGLQEPAPCKYSIPYPSATPNATY